MLSEVDTAQLQSELSTREGVTAFTVEPYEEYSLTIGGNTHKGTGPCVITVNID